VERFAPDAALYVLEAALLLSLMANGYLWGIARNLNATLEERERRAQIERLARLRLETRHDRRRVGFDPRRPLD
jgi:hypothetical protein